MKEYINAEIGKRIKDVRTQKNLKVFEIAEKAEVSNGLISRIENGRTIPSLPVLISIVKALDVRMDDFFADFSFDPPRKFKVKRASETREIEKEHESTGFHYNHILSQTIDCDSIETVILDLEPGAKREMVSTDAHEYKYVLEGEVEYHIDGDVVTLKQGDSLYFDGRLMHVPLNNSSMPARMLVVYLYK